MAQTTIVTDDLDGSPNAETIEFGFDGVMYTIDLARKNRTAFEKALKPYLTAATRQVARRSSSDSNTRRARRSSNGRRSSGVDLAAVRAWAAEQGIEVSSRGRVAQDVIDAYTASK